MKKETKTFNRITLDERGIIEYMYKKGYTIEEIAQEVQKTYHAIWLEIDRNSSHKIFNGKKVKIYNARTAQEIHEKRKENISRPSKINECKKFIKFVEKLIIKKKWSVETAVEVIKIKQPNLKSICFKTMYSYIDKGLSSVKNKNLIEKLKRKRKKKKIISKKVRFGGTSIDFRSILANDRLEFGHWEGDTVVGSKDDKNVLFVLTERKTRKQIIMKLENSYALTTYNAFKGIIRKYNRKVFKSLTLDNGSEFAFFPKFDRKSINIFFAHPYSSWQRGSCERANRLIRRFIPKSTPISLFSTNEIKNTEKWINTLPRKMFGWKTSNQLFAEEIKNLS